MFVYETMFGHNIFCLNMFCPDIFCLNIFCPVYFVISFVRRILSEFLLPCHPNDTSLQGCLDLQCKRCLMLSVLSAVYPNLVLSLDILLCATFSTGSSLSSGLLIKG